MSGPSWKEKAKLAQGLLNVAEKRLEAIAKLLEWPTQPRGLGEAANKALEIARGERAP